MKIYQLEEENLQSEEAKNDEKTKIHSMSAVEQIKPSQAVEELEEEKKEKLQSIDSSSLFKSSSSSLFKSESSISDLAREDTLKK